MIFRPLLRYYQLFISPIMSGKCIYTPTCSSYMGQAIKKHGIMVGIANGISRICRCTPFHKGGFDPVADNYRGNAKWLL